MKTSSFNLKNFLVLMTVMILAIFITRPAISQDNPKKESNKKIILKIISDDNGTKTVIDTTMEFNDDANMDSVRREIRKVFRVGKDGRRHQLKFRNMPRAFDYDFDVSSSSDCLKDLDELKEIEWEGMNMRSGNEGRTLSDVLGDIPMDRVTGYSIRERKNGRRIIIDLNNTPVFERQKKIIVIREPGKIKRHRNYQVTPPPPQPSEK
ncbi:MAG: hypothetical protein Q8M08_00290 [Bacteroidales bacterium]|nr:hypothetical protein [Bacteroidales bacterium]